MCIVFQQWKSVPNGIFQDICQMIYLSRKPFEVSSILTLKWIFLKGNPRSKTNKSKQWFVVNFINLIKSIDLH